MELKRQRLLVGIGVDYASVLRLAGAIRKLQRDDVLVIYREEDGHSTSYEDAKAAYEFVLDKVLRDAGGGEGGRASENARMNG